MPIENAHLVERIFGGWPSFHDAEIHSISMIQEGPTMDVVIHHWTTTDEIGPKGHYVQKDHTLTTFRFHQFSELDLKWFSYQNMLEELEIVESPTEPHFAVYMPSNAGCQAEFKCARIAIASSTPYSKV